MSHAEFAKWFAGLMGINVVLINVLVDEGIIGREDLEARFKQAAEAASRSGGSAESAAPLAAVADYLGADRPRFAS